MSDSDEDLMLNNISKYQHERTGIHTEGPYRNNTNTHITSFNIRNNNMMTSTFDMKNFERQRYREAIGKRNTYYRRETSPMSLRSFPNPEINNFHNSHYPRAMSSQRSVFNGRSGSPMSVRSIDSTASVSATDIALAFKNVKFNKYDLRIIKEAYSKFMKNRVRRRIEKRRNLKLFLKGTRKDIGYDSGELGSDSSISSDDCRSTRTKIYKENLPIPRPRQRPLKTDMTQLKNTIQESDLYQDCTKNLRQSSLRNMLDVKNTQVSTVSNTTIAKQQNSSVFNLKYRFAKCNSFVLPSQRFTRPGNKISNEESRSRSNTTQTSQDIRNFKEKTSNKSFERNSENEEIFSEVTVRENAQEPTLFQRKRNLELEDAKNCNIKRKKLMSPIKHTNESLISSSLDNTQNNDFTFKMPQMPIRKSTKGKDSIFNDKLIAKSAPPPLDDIEPDFSLHSGKQSKNKNANLEHNMTQEISQDKETEDINNETEISQNTTDLSMKPSFIRRKLYSQKIDVLDKKNVSIDNLALNSPQTKLYAGEKHKVRKLASSQSCLNTIDLDGDNVVDLIHKIVPRDKMNITNAEKQKETRKSQDDDKWDVTSVISMCNNDDISDTYTDEEIFKISQVTTNNKVNNDTSTLNKVNSEINKSCETKKAMKQKANDIPKNKNMNKNKINPVQCKVVLENISLKCNDNDQHKPLSNLSNKRTVSSCVKSFWDTDFESDMEERPHSTWNSKFATGKNNENNTIVNNTVDFPKKKVLKGTILTVRNTQNKGVNSSSRSDKSTVSQRNNQSDNKVIKEQIKKSNIAENLNTSITEVRNKRGRSKANDLNNSNSAPKCSNKITETCNRQKKCDAVKKNASKVTKIRILTPRKVNEKKRHSSPKSNESSFNSSNISSRSLRIRKKKNYKV